MPNQEQEKEPTLQAKKATPEAQKWHDYQLATRQKEPERIEDAAKYLSGMISISLTIFLAVNPDTFKEAPAGTALITAATFWLLSLLASFLVLFPVPYKYNRTSAEDIERMHNKTVRYKYFWLVLSASCFVVALGILAWQQLLLS